MRQQCVRPVDPGSTTRPGSVGADERQRTACTKRCDENNRVCLARLPSISICIGQARTACNEKCKERGDSPHLCALVCNSSEARWGWETRCTQEGDPGRTECVKELRNCVKKCLGDAN